MIAGSKRSFVFTTLISFALLVSLIAAGSFVQHYVSSAFQSSERIHQVRLQAQRALTLELDEETGIRGLAATGDAAFLQPYHEAQQPLDRVFAHLHSAAECCGLSPIQALLADAQRTRTEWSRRVAEPIIRAPRANGRRIQLYGKKLIDRYRNDFRLIDQILEAKDVSVANEVQASIDRIDSFIVIFAALLLIAAIAYGLEQLRANSRLAEQTAIAEDERRQRAELVAAYEVEKRIADTLQEAFTDRPLPLLENLRFSASYVAATEDTLVGGDWYDALALAGNRVLFAIGDVTGHGIEAAVTMNRARQSLLSSALIDPDPAAILQSANREIAKQDARLVTAVVGVADADTYEFCYAVAGHPPPVLLEPGRPPRFLECGSLPLGGFANAKYVTKHVQSVPGAVLVLYTDGAVEHSRDVIEGEKLLLEAISASRERTDRDAASFIHRAIFDGRSVGDDVAILTVGFSTDRALGLVMSGEKAQTEFSSRTERSAPPVGSKAARAIVKNDCDRTRLTEKRVS